ncbi:hypothetical protein F5Y00DRAFT_232702 [Daldinia vernicosa]|uniref:uncharacterized protein n=1 Tax=Daldinia vernicosa TaxID=114800 RepID=UPI002007A3F0|nr:uncharacterized protein F5Y00DRAFT_232702 [Daldinia vernicosa]KAI0850576.1 hypothetical protein F5Y00DRAFT_232702 [Daldinia vernicosa]
MASSGTSGKEAARRLVTSISKQHGYLGEEVYATMTPDTRRQVQEALLMAHTLVGTSVITLAKNLYTKDVRWIFELLQNAEDNCFSRAESLGVVPYVSFDVYKDRVVVECNEDGFTEANLRAICKIGASSKTGAQGYIGEKGIGFKSVFKAAWKVHIQSGDYSFTFTHRKGDSGMGMISPEWREPTEAIPTPLTRITLFLHANDVPGTEDARRQNILTQLNELQPTMLLFLKKLNQIKVHIYDDAGTEISSSLLEINHANQVGNRILDKVHTQDRNTTRTKQRYHIVEYIARNLPHNENRTYSPQEEASRAYSTAPVVLAFPLSHDDEPSIEQQEVFAFLPIRRAGFHFLIHSDFVTQANREDIVTTSSRNIMLLDSLAETFIIAMRSLCLHATLKYQWMRFLPKLSDYPWDPFWLKLVDKIKARIYREEIIILRDSTMQRDLSVARQPASNILDQHGDPLFDDLPGDKARYISSNYKSSDLDILQKYGLSLMYQDEVLERVSRDLSSNTSKMRSTGTDSDWHARAARSISLSYERKWQDMMVRTKTLQLIPLVDGTWVSPTPVDVYFATTSNGHAIPADLGFHLIDPVATAIPERRQLFLHLGAKYALVDNVRDKVFQRYHSTGVTGINYESSLAHLKFLYLTHNQNSTPDSSQKYENLWLWDDRGSIYPLKSHVSYSDKGFWELISKADKSPEWTDVHFINRKYFEDDPGKSSQHDVTWREWLETCLGVRNYSRLFDRDGGALSSECMFVEEYLPSEILNLLKQSWDLEKSRVTPELTELLGALEVPCQGGRLYSLASTYLPLPVLLKRRDEFMREDEFFPFIDINDDSDPVSQWHFLYDLGVSSRPDLEFYLKIYVWMHLFPTKELVDTSRVLRLYLRLHAECLDSETKEKQKEKQARIRDYFELHEALLIPPWEQRESMKAAPSKCLLNGPMNMETAFPVFPIYDAIYHAQFMDSVPGFSNFKSFLQETLEVKKCSWSHIVGELKHIKESNPPRLLDRVRELFSELSAMKLPRGPLEEMRNALENDALIFADVGPQKWYMPSQCLWCASSPIRGRVNLRNVYGGDMESFFVEKLAVRVLDADIVHNELLELKPEEATTERVKDLLWTFNSQIELKDFNTSPEKLLERRILPVRDVGGNVALHSAETGFGIIDRKKLGDAFYDKVKILDFTVNDVVKLKPLIKWAGLEDRYLSRLVQETSGLDSGLKTPISDPIQDIRRKAYGLLRIATHFKSPRIDGDGQALYDLLRNSRTWKTPEISTKLVLTIDGQTVSQDVDRGMIHIDDKDGLEIYVLRDEDLRDKSYLSIVPSRLAKWMMTDPGTNSKRDIDSSEELFIQAVLNMKPRQVDDYLTEKGIIEVTIPKQDDQEDALVIQRTPTLASTPTVVGPSTPRILRLPPSEPVTPLFDSESAYEDPETPATDYTHYSTSRTSSGRDRSSYARTGLSPDPFMTTVAERQRKATQEYCALLSQVIRKARKSRLLSEALDLSVLLDVMTGSNIIDGTTFNEDDLFDPQLGMSRFERDKKVGAAGELFVYELLSSMNPALRGFTRANWTSTIRKYVTVHPDYADMGSWSGIETSDIEYKDDNNKLTEVLISKGLLSSEWRGSRPKYYIEVKTTPGGRDTPFFMSDAQYHKMERLSTEDSIYVIFRVSELYSGRITVDLYVDPLKLVGEGRLVFTADRWTVKPVFTFNWDTPEYN